MLTNLSDRIEILKNKLLAEHPNRFRGYGLSNGNGARMRELREQAEIQKRTHAEWAAVEEKERKRRAVIDTAHRLIEWAHAEYEGAKIKHQRNIRVYAELTLHWSAARVLTTHKDFAVLCQSLYDEKTWRMLTRKERAFIADAVALMR